MRDDLKKGYSMARIARIPITNIYAGGDYSGRILIGAEKKPMNVLLDTGSSALALDGTKYTRGLGDKTTRLAQSDVYGDDSSWLGAVIQTTVSIGEGKHQVTLTGANAALAYKETADMFAPADGILGLAYARLDDAHEMAGDTSETHFSRAQVNAARITYIKPYLTQLTRQNVVSDKFAFYTLRSMIHAGRVKPANDPLNKGWMIVGGGEEAKDLYTGKFQTAKVLSDEWYNTNVKAIIVGDTDPIQVRPRGVIGSPSNSIVDSGTNGLVFPAHLLKIIVSKFTAQQQRLLVLAMRAVNNGIEAGRVKLAEWPDITIVLQGSPDDAVLKIVPRDYWQIDADVAGRAKTTISAGGPSDGIILGLPLMNNYFTIFDGEADRGKGEIRFALAKR
jgi:hypothetical protein